MTIYEKIAVMQACADGKTIEAKSSITNWTPINNPCWNWEVMDYRVKPEPREWMVPLHVLEQGNAIAWAQTNSIKVREVLE